MKKNLIGFLIYFLVDRYNQTVKKEAPTHVNSDIIISSPVSSRSSRSPSPDFRADPEESNWSSVNIDLLFKYASDRLLKYKNRSNELLFLQKIKEKLAFRVSKNLK